MIDFVQLQIAVSTADEESDRFVGQYSPAQPRGGQVVLPDGIYRVVAGELCRILPGAPPVGSEAADVGENVTGDR